MVGRLLPKDRAPRSGSSQTSSSLVCVSLLAKGTWNLSSYQTYLESPAGTQPGCPPFLPHARVVILRQFKPATPMPFNLFSDTYARAALTALADTGIDVLLSWRCFICCLLFCSPSLLQVLDPPQGDEAGPASRGAFGIHAGAELATEAHRLWSAMAETSHATASRFSRLVSSYFLV